MTDYLRKHTVVMAQLPTPQIALLLRQSQRRPVLTAQSINVDPLGQPVQYGITRFAGDWVHLSLQTGDT